VIGLLLTIARGLGAAFRFRRRLAPEPKSMVLLLLWSAQTAGLAQPGAQPATQPATQPTFQPELTPIQPSTPQVQWAARVLGFSSQNGEKGFGAIQALGQPNKMPASGISEVAWMPDMRSRLPLEWIRVAFERPEPAEQVLLAENSRPGAVAAVFLYDAQNNPYAVYRAADSAVALPPGQKSRLLAIRFARTEFDVHAAMVVLRSPDSIPLYQLDAIGIAPHSQPVELTIREWPLQGELAEPENLGPAINSPYDDVFPVISPDGNTLFFDRKQHPENLGGRGMDDIWISERDSAGQWSEARNAGPPLNNAFHNFVCSISPDGNTLLLGNAYQAGGGVGSGLSISYRTREGWSAPKPVPVRDYYNLDAFGEFQLAANGSVILLAIERRDGYGKRDLYASFRMPDDGWSAPLNLGPDVNTAGLEMSPFLAPDMRTLYFSSSGFPGYGRNDMFMSRRLDESWTSWSEPVNLGKGLNSAGMDAYYTLPATGDFAYFASSNRSLGGSDLYRVALPPDLQPEPVLLLRGRVLDALSGEPVEAEIGYRFAGSDSLAGVARSEPESGAYRLALPLGERYRIEARASGYFALMENLELGAKGGPGDGGAELDPGSAAGNPAGSADGGAFPSELERDLLLIPLRPGSVVPMRELFFPVNSDSLLPGSYRELERVADLLKRYPSLRIEIGGHTNNRCSESFCVELSRKRAASVARYLAGRGYGVKRVQWVGYGSAKPIADNNTEEGRNLNQRVEFRILDISEAEGQQGEGP
jgi:OmpA-OmpF porin, OOP family